MCGISSKYIKLVYMRKNQDQKLKILYVKEYIELYSSKENPVNANQIIEYLSLHEISAERKSIYDDINTLINYGLNIVKVQGREGGYYIGDRYFSQDDISILLDNLSSSKYVSTKDLDYFQGKLANLLKLSERDNIKHNIYVPNRERNLNTNLFNNISELSLGIKKEKLVKFQYLEWQLAEDNSRVFYELAKRHDGKFYKVHPLQIVYYDQNYYLIAIDLKAQDTRHYRIDKIVNLDVTDDRDKKAVKLATRFDPARYSKSLFEMFDGEEKNTKLIFHKDVLGAMLERFGENMILLKSKEENYYETIQLIKTGPKFYGWVLSYDQKIRVIGPDSVVEDMSEFIQRNSEDY